MIGSIIEYTGYAVIFGCIAFAWIATPAGMY